jgi:hypothetical protein
MPLAAPAALDTPPVGRARSNHIAVVEPPIPTAPRAPVVPVPSTVPGPVVVAVLKAVMSIMSTRFPEPAAVVGMATIVPAVAVRVAPVTIIPMDLEVMAHARTERRVVVVTAAGMAVGRTGIARMVESRRHPVVVGDVGTGTVDDGKRRPADDEADPE